MFRGVRLEFKKEKCLLFIFTNSIDPDEMQHYIIWVFTVCKNTRLGVSLIQRVKRFGYLGCVPGLVHALLKVW